MQHHSLLPKSWCKTGYRGVLQWDGDNGGSFICEETNKIVGFVQFVKKSKTQKQSNQGHKRGSGLEEISLNQQKRVKKKTSKQKKRERK